jgi:hypothetical protein
METTAVDLRPARLLAGAMLAVAAVRPLLPVETVPPCPLRALTGVPCPLCGMTRGVTAAVHGHLGHAIALNPASIVAVVLALVLLFVPRLPKAIVVPVWTIVAVLGAMWTYQLFKYSTGRPL